MSASVLLGAGEVENALTAWGEAYSSQNLRLIVSLLLHSAWKCISTLCCLVTRIKFNYMPPDVAFNEFAGGSLDFGVASLPVINQTKRHLLHEITYFPLFGTVFPQHSGIVLGTIIIIIFSKK